MSTKLTSDIAALNKHGDLSEGIKMYSKLCV